MPRTLGARRSRPNVRHGHVGAVVELQRKLERLAAAHRAPDARRTTPDAVVEGVLLAAVGEGAVPTLIAEKFEN